MSTKEVQNLRLSVTLKISRLSNTEGFLDTDSLSVLNAELTAENSSVEMSNPNMLKETLERLRRLDERIDECEEMFHSYNVPRVTDFSSTKACESAVNQFMNIWREKSKRGRETGRKSLSEWLSQTNLYGGDCARLSEISLGTRISFCIASYFALIAQSSADKEEFDRRVRNIAAAIGCLRVEEGTENDRLIKTFLLAVSNARSALMSGTVGETFRGLVSVTPAAGESDVIHLILREILRLEVAFNCPDLPMKLTEEVLSSMSDHLLAVFDEKLARVWAILEKVEEELDIVIEDESDRRIKEVAFKELYAGVQGVWDELLSDKLKLAINK